MTDETTGNGGSGGEEVSLARVDLPADVVENDPEKDYVVVRFLPDGPEMRFPKDMIVRLRKDTEVEEP